MASRIFVGRERELAELETGLKDALTGRGGLLLVGGDPGIGKSALAEELSRSARERGARVVSGRCWEAGGAPPYWPWVQSLRALLDELDEEAVRSHLGASGSDIAQMLPELGSLPGVQVSPRSADSDAARFQLFDATTAFLRSVARDRALVVILEDLHAADRPSLLLLEFVTRALAHARILILGTYRDVEVGRDHPLSATLPELAREFVTRRLILTGLHPSGVERFIAKSAGVRPSGRLVDWVYRQTEGNPLFVGEIVRLLASEGRLSRDPEAALKPIPQGIRDVIARRVDRISERCHRVLGIASVLGREFTLDALELLSELPADDLLDILDEASDARLVTDTPGGLGGMRFSHSLIRDAMYEEMSVALRIRLHRRAAETLERIRSGNPDHLAEIAHHYFDAAATGYAAKAVDYATAAAEHALRRLAFEEAARLFEMALKALELGSQPDEEARYDLLMSLGDALTRAGDAESARDYAYRAAEIARRRGKADRLGRAALLYGGSFAWGALRGDTRFVPLLEDALAAVTAAGTDPAMRVKLMGRLAAGPWRDRPDRAPRLKLISEAVELARSLEDPGTLAYALDARLSANLGPIDLDEMVGVANELEHLAKGLNDGEKLLMSHVWRLVAHLYRGDMPQVIAERDAMARLTERLRQGPQNWFLIGTNAQLAFFAGRFDQAEELATSAYEAGRRTEPYALFAYRVQMLWMRMEQARTAEMTEEFRDSIQRFAVYPVWRAMVPFLLLAYRTDSEARAAFRETFPAPRPFNEEYLLGAGVLADAAASLGEHDAGRRLYEELVPYSDLTMGGIPDINIGSTHRVLGRLAHLLGMFEDAERHFLSAIEANDRTGARPWAAWARQAYATLLSDRNGTASRERGATLLAEASAAGRDMGMRALQEKIGAVSTVLERTTAPIRAEEPSPAVFRREGEYWTITFAGSSFRLRDTKGLRYLARLLMEPGREFLALDLVAEHEPGVKLERNGSLRPGHQDAGSFLDEQAKSAYRERLHDLQSEQDEAESRNDTERAGRARLEMEFIARELARAVGLAGRDRVSGSPGERARQSVTHAIQSAMRRITAHDRALAEHLEATVHTGTYCAYRPDPRVSIRWQL